MDGIEIQKSERIAAMQNYNHLRKRFVKESIEMGNSPSEEATTTTTTEQEEVNQPDQEADKER